MNVSIWYFKLWEETTVHGQIPGEPEVPVKFWGWVPEKPPVKREVPKNPQACWEVPKIPSLGNGPQENPSLWRGP